MSNQQQTLDALNDYVGLDIWGDLINQLPGYDEAANQELDPAYRSDVAVIDGVIYRWDQQQQIWRVRDDQQGTDMKRVLTKAEIQKLRVALHRQHQETRARMMRKLVREATRERDLCHRAAARANRAPRESEVHS